MSFSCRPMARTVSERKKKKKKKTRQENKLHQSHDTQETGTLRQEDSDCFRCVRVLSRDGLTVL